MIHHSKRCDYIGFLAAMLAAASCLAFPATAQKYKMPAEPIVIDSVASNLDDDAKTADFTSVSVTQGRKRLTADHASVTGVGFQNSRWIFAGRVIITSNSGGSLWADQATLEYRDGELVQATATGSPVRFEQRRTGAEPTQHGQADELTYDAKRNTVHLHGHATLSNGPGMDISSPILVYHVRENTWQALSGDGTKAVHIITGATDPVFVMPHKGDGACAREPCK